MTTPSRAAREIVCARINTHTHTHIRKILERLSYAEEIYLRTG